MLEPLSGYLKLARKLYEGDINFVGPWNFAPDEKNYITVETLVKKAIETTGKGSYRVNPPKEEKHEAHLLKLDSSKAKHYLDWHPKLGINETLEWTFEWYKKFYEKNDVSLITQEQINSYFI